MRKLYIPAAIAMALLAGCTQDPAAPRRICILQETGDQVPDSRCEGAGEPGVTEWYWVQPEADDDDDDDFHIKKPKSKTSTKSTTWRRR